MQTLPVGGAAAVLEISRAELLRRLHDPTLVIVDVLPAAAFAERHIAGPEGGEAFPGCHGPEFHPVARTAGESLAVRRKHQEFVAKYERQKAAAQRPRAKRTRRYAGAVGVPALAGPGEAVEPPSPR